MDRELRTLLQDKADEVRLHGRIPEDVLRRSRRRRAVMAALAGAVTVGLALGAFVGARELLSETTSPGPLRPAAPIGESYPYIWPATLGELELTQRQVAEGHVPLWTVPEQVAGFYVRDVMGWDLADAVLEVQKGGPVVVVATNPTVSDIRTRLIMALVAGEPGPDDDIYAVSSAETDAISLEEPIPGDLVVPGSRMVVAGRLLSEEPGLTVSVTLEWSNSAAGSGAIGGGPSFRHRVPVPPDVQGAPVARIAVHRGTDDEILALTSFRLEEGGAAGASEPELVIPPRIAETREALLSAAQARDWEALRALISDKGFTFSFGGETDPIRYWKRLESEGHVPVMGDILPAVLETDPGFERGVFVWPAQATEDPARWDPADIEALAGIHAEEDVRAFQEAGLYYGWRLGIDQNGTWVFFVAGD
ncbi:MAG TPA: hypothetical protein VE737_03000 [Actinomycetota bacterium]|nr:hypothetical protein [Actinomycetota bacterium]